jgi:hypothetical protein
MPATFLLEERSPWESIVPDTMGEQIGSDACMSNATC